ncbi:MAG: NosD domain-containing protein [Candidatus Aenigmatarchaeota archaeon]
MSWKKIIFAVLPAILFLFLISEVRAQTPISDCTIILSSGNYYLTQDIYYDGNQPCITILANNVDLDCQNHLIYGIDASNSAGISVVQSSNVNVRNCRIKDFYKGIHTDVSNEVTFYNISLESNSYGAYVENSQSVYVIGESGNTIVTGNYYGIFFYNTSYLLRIKYQQLIGNTFGIWGSSSSAVVVENNVISGSSTGLFLGSVSNGNVVENKIYDNGIGVELTSVSLMNFYDNEIRDNSNYGLKATSSVNNNNFYNNLFRNSNNIYTAGLQTNKWNTTKQLGRRIYGTGDYIGGNYWSNPEGTGYSDTCSDSDKDGFCDSPYTVSSNNIDYLPLTSLREYTLNIAVYDTCSFDSDQCFLDVSNPTIQIWKEGIKIVERSFNATIPNCPNKCPQPIQKACSVLSVKLAEGTYTIKVYKTGYNSFEGDLLLNMDLTFPVLLSRENSYTIKVKVMDSINRSYIKNILRCLYYSNGSVVPDPYPNAKWCAEISGTGEYSWYCAPRESYYYTISADGYQPYRSSTFYLNADREDIVLLSPTAYTPPGVICGNGICEPPYENATSCPQDCALLAPIPQINKTEWEEMGYGWLVPLFSPFAIYNLIMISFAVLGGVITREASAVLGIILVFVAIYTFMGIYPWWLGVVLIIIAGFLFVNLIGIIFVRK